MSFDHLPPRAATYWRELAERASKAAKYYRGRTRDLSKRVLELEAENRALRVERDAADLTARRAVDAHTDCVQSLRLLGAEVDYLKAVARDLKAIDAQERS